MTAVESARWEDQALCRGAPGEVFFPPAATPTRNSADIYNEARAICAGCPVHVECLAEAIASFDLSHGYRGRMTPQQRREAFRAGALRPPPRRCSVCDDRFYPKTSDNQTCSRGCSIVYQMTRQR